MKNLQPESVPSTPPPSVPSPPKSRDSIRFDHTDEVFAKAADDSKKDRTSKLATALEPPHLSK